MTGSADKTAIVTVDARGMRCPWPILRAARAMRTAERILLIADDPAARQDMADMATARGWSCRLDQEGDLLRFTLQKRCDPPPL